MEYQKIINLLNNRSNQPSKFRTRNWPEINDESWGMYDVNSETTFKTSVIRSSLCDCSDPCIHVKRTIRIANTAAAPAVINNTNKKVLFKPSAPFSNCISE